MQSNYQKTVTGTFNFAADKNDGGEFSNTKPERSRQNLRPVDVEIRNGRIWPEKPTLKNEGVMLAEHVSGKADWSNPEWITSEYVPSCVELIKKLTGAKQALPIYVPLQRRVDYGKYAGAAPTAGFVHLDQTRDIAQLFAGKIAESQGVTFKRAAIYNVWKCMTPSPQDFPLAVSDRRSIPQETHVQGSTVEYIGEKEEKFVSPYLSLVPAEEQIYYYFPDMSTDESIVFVGVDLDPSHPLGCAHSAFKHPAPDGECVPRASIEARVLAIFE
jgi:hypothetical protein